MPKHISVGGRQFTEYGRPRDTARVAKATAHKINTYGLTGNLAYAVVREYKGKYIVYVCRTNTKNPVTKSSFGV